MKSVVASMVVPLIVVCEAAPIVAPSIVPPFISALLVTRLSSEALVATEILPNEPVDVALPLTVPVLSIVNV